mmetsp:Transcript_81321/g.143400  ORF Transcript_81321/g.143400 Transcript_81321/m.143400 type:complete len:226 (+) Transcript_81321:124-801(+)
MATVQINGIYITILLFVCTLSVLHTSWSVQTKSGERCSHCNSKLRIVEPLENGISVEDAEGLISKDTDDEQPADTNGVGKKKDFSYVKQYVRPGQRMDKIPPDKEATEPIQFRFFNSSLPLLLDCSHLDPHYDLLRRLAHDSLTLEQATTAGSNFKLRAMLEDRVPAVFRFYRPTAYTPYHRPKDACTNWASEVRIESSATDCRPLATHGICLQCFNEQALPTAR